MSRRFFFAFDILDVIIFDVFSGKRLETLKDFSEGLERAGRVGFVYGFVAGFVSAFIVILILSIWLD